MMSADMGTPGLHFNPRAPYGARPGAGIGPAARDAISIHAPHTGRDIPAPASNFVSRISIHAPHTGRDETNTPPAAQHPNFNPRAPYGARPASGMGVTRRQQISIHAPHTGRDRWTDRPQPVPCGFQSTRPIRGATLFRLSRFLRCRIFQSTRPIRGATRGSSSIQIRQRYFNPRAPYGARHNRLSDNMLCNNISIHAPHTGRDDSGPGWTTTGLHFNPRAPYGARRSGVSPAGPCGGISIHAPHTGRDLHLLIVIYQTGGFQSTRPIRGATVCGWAWFLALSHFNPRAPYGARRHQSAECP